jgi:hypothetical protein
VDCSCDFSIFGVGGVGRGFCKTVFFQFLAKKINFAGWKKIKPWKEKEKKYHNTTKCRTIFHTPKQCLKTQSRARAKVLSTQQ